MAFNAFTQVRLSADGATLFLDGHSKDGFEAQKVEGVVISTKDDDKRAAGSVEGDPLPDGWVVAIDQVALEPERRFADGDFVYVVGVATPSSGEPFIWGGITTTDGAIKVPAQVEIKPAP